MDEVIEGLLWRGFVAKLAFCYKPFFVGGPLKDFFCPLPDTSTYTQVYRDMRAYVYMYMYIYIYIRIAASEMRAYIHMVCRSIEASWVLSPYNLSPPANGS